MSTYYRNLPRHLSEKEERRLDALVSDATGRPNACIGCPPRHEYPRVWLEDCPEGLAERLDRALQAFGLLVDDVDRELAEMGLVREEEGYPGRSVVLKSGARVWATERP